MLRTPHSDFAFAPVSNSTHSDRRAELFLLGVVVGTINKGEFLFLVEFIMVENYLDSVKPR